jgi:WD40 repeat protein
MGAFYGSIQFRTEDRDAVLAAVDNLARRQKTAMLVGPVLRGWVGVYPAGNGQDDNVSKLLAKKLPGDVLHLIVHDDDFFTYAYYHDGKVVDRYHSSAEYFGSVSAQAKARLRGRPDRLAHLLPDPARLTDLRDLLVGARSPGMVFASRHLERFAELLDLANAAEAYEYLREADGEGVEGWDEFTHVPDLAEERGRQLARAADIARTTQQLKDDGLLRHVETRTGKIQDLSSTPHYCPDGADGFLVFWHDWQASVGIDLEPSASGIARSPSGRYLAVGHSYGDWTARLWDLTAGRLVRDVPHARGVVWLGVSPDEQLLATVGIQDCAITRTDTGERIATATISNGKAAAIHPDGTLIVSDQTGHLHLVDLVTGAMRKTLLVGGRAQMEEQRNQQRSILAYMLNSWDTPESQQRSEELLQQMEARARRTSGTEGGPAELRIDVTELRRKMEAMKASTAARRASLEAGELPKQGSETPACLATSPNGRWLAIGTTRGVRVFAWDAVAAASDYMPDPVARHDTIRGPYGGETNYVWGVAWYKGGPGVFFGGLEGSIDYLNVDTGAHRVLCELPGRISVAEHKARIQQPGCEDSGGPAILSLALSTDETSLASCIAPEFFSRNHRRPLELMIWDVAALLRR